MSREVQNLRDGLEAQLLVLVLIPRSHVSCWETFKHHRNTCLFVFMQAFRDIWANERLLNVAEQLLGTSDILGHPVWNLRCKTPSSTAATVPWHQGLFCCCFYIVSAYNCACETIISNFEQLSLENNFPQTYYCNSSISALMLLAG